MMPRSAYERQSSLTVLQTLAFSLPSADRSIAYWDPVLFPVQKLSSVVRVKPFPPFPPDEIGQGLLCLGASIDYKRPFFFKSSPPLCMVCRAATFCRFVSTLPPPFPRLKVRNSPSVQPSPFELKTPAGPEPLRQAWLSLGQAVQSCPPKT